MDNIEKQFIDSKSNVTPKSSPAKSVGFKTPKSSPSKSKTPDTTPNLLPDKSYLPSPAKSIQTILVSHKTKRQSISPRKCDLNENTGKIKIKSPKKKLFCNNDTTVKTGFKRKLSPIKTPENKKIKVNLVQSPDTQVSNFFLFYLIFYCNKINFRKVDM